MRATAKALAALGGGVVIAQIDPEGRPVEEWTLKNAWISAVSFGDTLDYTSDEATELSITIKYDWAEMTVFGEPVAGMGGKSHRSASSSPCAGNSNARPGATAAAICPASWPDCVNASEKAAGSASNAAQCSSPIASATSGS